MITIEYTINSHACSAAQLIALLEDGEIVSGLAIDNKKYYDRGTSELLEEADLEYSSRIEIVGYDDDTACMLKVVVKYPLLNELDIKERITTSRKSGALEYWKEQASQ